MATTLKTRMDANQLVRWEKIGDSFLECEGVDAFNKTWTQIALGLMRSHFGCVGTGIGSIPANRYLTYLTTGSANWRQPMSGTSLGFPNWNYSLGFKGVRFTGPGQYREATVTGTAVEIIHLQPGAGSGAGTLTVTLNGNPVAGGTITTAVDPYIPSKRTLINFPAPGTYTVRVTSSGPNYLDGLAILNGESDANGGIVLYDNSRTGAGSNIIAKDDVLNGVAAIAPHFIVDDQFGANDFFADGISDPGLVRIPSTVAADMLERLNFYASLPTAPTVIFMIPWNLPALSGTNIAGYSWAQYRDACLAVIAGHSYTTHLFDLAAVYPNAASEPWHDPDNLHPNAAGQNAIATAFSAFVISLDSEEGPFNRETFDWLRGLGYTGSIADMQNSFLRAQPGVIIGSSSDMQKSLNKKPRELLRRNEWL